MDFTGRFNFGMVELTRMEENDLVTSKNCIRRHEERMETAFSRPLHAGREDNPRRLPEVTPVEYREGLAPRDPDTDAARVTSV